MGIAEEARPYTELDDRDLGLLIELVGLAHVNKPGTLSVEIGTRAGGSALAILKTLQQVYAPYPAPMVFTVDPYGNKPYPKGVVEMEELTYGDDFYLQSKSLLAPFSNHAHFLMTGEAFVERVLGTTYWYLGEEKKTDISFAFLDGDHSKATVLRTLKGLAPHLLGGAIVLLDNADWEGQMIRELLELPFHLSGYNGKTCVLVKT